MSTNNNLHKAKEAKNDEFYTRYEDIEAEVQHYKEQLRGQIVYCPCDDYRISNFVKFFKDHFEEYGLKELLATNYDIGKGSYYYRYDGEEYIEAIENGDYRQSTIKADIIITNPPFSLFRDFIDWVKDKDFLILGTKSAASYKNVFPLIKDGKLRLGWTKTQKFINTDKKVPTYWYTNMKTGKKKILKATELYDAKKYPKYSNYDAVECGRLKDFPADYDGVIGVPITIVEYLDDDGYINVEYDDKKV